MKFTKMHGLGNDYVYVNCFEQSVENPSRVARQVSDRHFGIGSDGLILILPSDKADVRMRMFNVDGSEGEMCGNGVRCVAKYAYDHGLARNNPMKVETGRGVLDLKLHIHDDKVTHVTVNMGQPILDPARIGFDPEAVMRAENPQSWFFQLERTPFEGVPVSVGNPHVVFWTHEIESLDLPVLGPLAESHPAFPRRVNAHWAQVIQRNEMRMRTWERGSGATLACGTGATAVCVAGVLTGRTDRDVLIHLPGGDLQLEWRESDNCVYKTGPATEVFSGEWNG